MIFIPQFTFRRYSGTMKTLVCEAPGNFNYQDSEIPALTKNHSILKIKNIGICGTDLHAFEGKQPFFNYPRILGHELAGEIVAADGAPDFLLGKPLPFSHTLTAGFVLHAATEKPIAVPKFRFLASI